MRKRFHNNNNNNNNHDKDPKPCTHNATIKKKIAKQTTPQENLLSWLNNRNTAKPPASQQKIEVQCKKN